MGRLAGFAALAVGSILSLTTVAAAQTAADYQQAARAAQAEAADPLAEALSAYAAFQGDVIALRDGRFTRTADVEAALDRIAATNADQLARGFLAYGALTAAKTPEFAAEARGVAQAYGPDAAARGFAVSGAYAVSLKGGAEARQTALATAHAEGARLFTIGDSVKTQAMALSKSAWAKTRVSPQRTARLTRLRELFASSSPRALEPAMAQRLAAARAAGMSQDPSAMGGRDFWDALQAGEGYASLASYTPQPPMSVAPQQEAAVEAMMSLAALSAMDGFSRLSAADIDRLLAHGPTKDCFERARLQFIQCVSAGEFAFENLACVGEAGLQTRGMCIRDIAKVGAAGSVASNEN